MYVNTYNFNCDIQISAVTAAISHGGSLMRKSVVVYSSDKLWGGSRGGSSQANRLADVAL